MAIFNFQKPDKVIMIDSTDFEGKFEFRPLEPGYGLTVGNALRRVLLSALEGYAITSIRIDGVEHEFSSLIEKIIQQNHAQAAVLREASLWDGGGPATESIV